MPASAHPPPGTRPAAAASRFGALRPRAPVRCSSAADGGERCRVCVCGALAAFQTTNHMHEWPIILPGGRSTFCECFPECAYLNSSELSESADLPPPSASLGARRPHSAARLALPLPGCGPLVASRGHVAAPPRTRPRPIKIRTRATRSLSTTTPLPRIYIGYRRGEAAAAATLKFQENSLSHRSSPRPMQSS